MLEVDLNSLEQQKLTKEINETGGMDTFLDACQGHLIQIAIICKQFPRVYMERAIFEMYRSAKQQDTTDPWWVIGNAIEEYYHATNRALSAASI